MRAPLLLPLLVALAPFAAAQGTPVREGEVVPFRGGETRSWDAPAQGRHVLHVRAGASDVEVQWLRPERGARRRCRSPRRSPASAERT